MPLTRKSHISAAVAALLVISVPTWADEADDTSTDDGNKVQACINVSSINGFNAIDNKHLTVNVGASKTYLVTLTNTCHDLKWADDIRYDATMSWSCTNTKDKIIVNGLRCYIDTIELVEDRDEAKALVEERDEKQEE